jgi:Flp pilus assembly protein CpaB
MCKKNVWIPAALLLLAAGFWAGLAYRQRFPSQAYELTQVLVARADLPAGTVLKEDLVETRQLPRCYMEQDAYEVRAMSDVKLLNGLTAAVRIPKGNQLTRSSLADKGGKTADAGLPPGHRHYLEGIKHFQKADYEKAREEWQAAIKLDPSNAGAAAGLKRIKQITRER